MIFCTFSNNIFQHAFKYCNKNVKCFSFVLLINTVHFNKKKFYLQRDGLEFTPHFWTLSGEKNTKKSNKSWHRVFNWEWRCSIWSMNPTMPRYQMYFRQKAIRNLLIGVNIYFVFVSKIKCHTRETPPKRIGMYVGM